MNITHITPSTKTNKNPKLLIVLAVALTLAAPAVVLTDTAQAQGTCKTCTLQGVTQGAGI